MKNTFKNILLLSLALSSSLVGSAQGVNDWENPELTEINREPMRSTFDHYATFEQAQTFGRRSPFVQSLNGVWRFNYVHNHQERPMEFYQEGFDHSSWADITVPGAWEVQGFGTLIYTNARYPYLNNPPYIESKYGYGTPVGSYLREFDMPTEWKGREIFVNLGGVASAYYIWINGHKVGYAQDSSLPSEFNITKYLRAGTNSIALQVFRWSDGSYLEDQDGWRVSGITRDVELIAKPKSHIADIAIVNNLDAEYNNATTSIRVDLNNAAAKKGRYTISATLLDGRSVIAQSASKVTMQGGSSEQVTLNMNINEPRKWSCEQPNLYTVVVELKDSKGKNIDVVNSRTGYRKIEIDGRVFKLNGEPIKMKGVCRVANDPFSAKTISKERILEEVLLMKRNNINTIRTSHMPASRWLYEYCDQYGIMIIDEANVESHGMDYGPRTLAKPVEWKHAHVERMTRMIERDKNHASVLHWSLGNEAGNGPNMRAMHLAAKELDSTRVTHYHFSNNPICCDVIGGGLVKRGRPNSFGRYQYVFDLDSIATCGDKRPYLLNEFAHAMGNSIGNLKEYAVRFDKYDWLIGGTIWDWSDQSVIIKSDDHSIYGMMIPEDERAYALAEAAKPNGKYFYGYGGDFGDTVNDYNFLNNGVVPPDLKGGGKLAEVSKCFQDIEFFAVDLSRGEVEIFNKFYFTPLSDLRMQWTLLHNGVEVQRGVFQDVDIAPQQRGVVTLPLSEMKMSCEGEYVVVLSAHLKEDTRWAQSGYRIAWEQMVMQPWNFEVAIEECNKAPKVVKGEESIEITSGGSVILFDLAQARISSIELNGEPLLTSGPRLDFWRAPLDNDGTRPGKFDGQGNFKEDAAGGRLSGLWKDAGYDNMKRKIEAVSTDIIDNKAVIDVKYRLSGATADIWFDAQERYTFNGEGEFELSSKIVASEAAPEVARVGYEAEVASAFDQFEYYGMGESEAYCDKRDGAIFGRYAGDVDSQFVSYIYPQENGNKYNVRWASVTSKEGKGILVRGAEPIETSIRHFTTANLAKATHTTELEKIDNSIWNINHRSAPIGNESVGIAPLDEYVLDQGEWSFAFYFKIVE